MIEDTSKAATIEGEALSDDELKEVSGGVDFEQLRRDNLDKDASRLDEIRRENLEKD
ncbi:bacteriocin [Leptolyngbya sp. CCNP1308]|uniref:bacteriocin n=1 Tax=Leptolyngbya sp. CCNP1308 TaxID=3110255 RepID=UPI002B20B9C6|nr:bacteriocin [Leptolyngbya sp. CCNP1308]MEA5449686.1 bacteriocin [Leptolyngbya sp. CCNP1308]